MTSQTLKAIHQTRPFVPFRIHLAGGQTIDVKHPETIAYSEGSRTAVVLTGR